MLAICHSYYSLQCGVRSPQDWAEAALHRGYEALAVADVNGLYGAVHAWRAIVAVGLQPIVGAELFLDSGCFCTALVSSSGGYHQLCRLLSARHLSSSFRFAESARDGGVDELLFLTRPGVGEAILREVVPPENLYLQPPIEDSGGLWSVPSSKINYAGIPDAWLIEESDRRTFADLATLRGLKGEANDGMYTGSVLPERGEWANLHSDYEKSAGEIVERCRFAFDFEACHLPRLAIPGGASADQHLGALCCSGLVSHYEGGMADLAKDRLVRELSVIEQSGFSDYFLYVNEIIGFARRRGIPVEVRGSAASSIVSYLLGFTHCCPIENDLYFERFMNPGRGDCPDIDIDIADKRRDEVVNYCYDRWGEEHVAMVATVQTYRGRGALRDAGRLMGIAASAVSSFIERGVEFPGVERLCETAGRLTGLPRHLGVHCGGLIITPFPLTDIAPLFRSAKGISAIHYEKDQAEAIGLVKMDLLGNSALSVIAEGKHWLSQRGVDLEEPGPRHDFKVNRLFANGDTLGVYQCESPGMRQICRALKPRSRKQVAMALSLIRPGPAAAGMKDAFIRRLRGYEPVSYLHPKMADFLESTYGVMLYQEDVMKVAVNLAGYTVADADNLRRAAKGKGGAKFQDEKNRFIFEKASGAGVEQAVAEEIWNQVAKFASYSFCKAHASVYGRLAWLTARLKAHYPCEFYTAILNCHASMYPRRVFVWDAIRHGIPVLPPDLYQSEIDWRPTRQGVRAGLGLVGGIHRETIRKLLEERQRGLFADICDLRKRVPFRSGELERLIVLGCCHVLGDREELFARLSERYGTLEQPLLFATAGGSQAIRIPAKIKAELSLTGIPFSLHPVEILGRDICRAVEMPNYVNRNVEMFGILDAVKHTRAESKKGNTSRCMSFATLEDPSGTFEVVLFPDTHERFGHLFNSPGPYLVGGE